MALLEDKKTLFLHLKLEEAQLFRSTGRTKLTTGGHHSLKLKTFCGSCSCTRFSDSFHFLSSQCIREKKKIFDRKQRQLAAAVKLFHDIFGAQSQSVAVDFSAAATERLEFQRVTTVISFVLRVAWNS